MLDRDDEHVFYENGHVGLRDAFGNEIFPAIYDEIIDWTASGCDVVYVRKGNEFHYYNHAKEEILTDVESIDEDRYPLAPYSFGEDQNRNVLLCVEPAGKVDSKDCCFAFSQWARLSRIRRSEVRDFFASCSIVPMDDVALRDFYAPTTYIYSARLAKASGVSRIPKCLEVMGTLGTYDTSWAYLLKISFNPKDTLDVSELYSAITHFEDLDDCIDYHIAVDIDNTLPIGEITIFQIHYFRDDGPEFLSDIVKQEILPKGSLEAVRNAVEHYENRQFLLDRAYRWIEYDEHREWQETEQVLDWLYSQGARDIHDLIERATFVNPFYIEKISPSEWRHRKRVIRWSMRHGGHLNRIKEGETPFDRFARRIQDAKKHDKEDQHSHVIEPAQDFLSFLREQGACTAEEERKKMSTAVEKMSMMQIIEYSR